MEPWLASLRADAPEEAWARFHERYHRLIVATIRRLVPDHDDVMDVYSGVCQALSANACARLRTYSERAEGRAGAGTWLVAVVRNLTVDWLRQQHGRTRVAIPQGLTERQQEIYRAICLDGHSAVEAYELISSRAAEPMTFPAFLREVRATGLAAPCPGHVYRRRPQGTPPLTPDPMVLEADPVESAQSVRILERALEALAPDLLLAVKLFVVEELPAARVASLVGWPNARTVYNRVSRALARIREEFRRKGIGPGDL
jgi:RNA polymerase sigma factor (sigma-70 family)